MSGPPLWQRAVVGAQARANPALRALVDNEDVAAGLALVQAVRRGAVRAAEGPTRRALNILNLPAASDMRGLRVQIASLERQVRELRQVVEDSHPEVEDPYP